MKVLKPVYITGAIALALIGCKSISKIPVPLGTENVVSISEKKAPLTKQQKQTWGHADLAKDTIPGMSIAKAYDFLKGKKGVEVVVGVVDSGTDLTHEDLAENAWVNTKEIPNNGKDDDKNGYVDDINGWNFLGSIYNEHLEYERILMNPSISDTENLVEIEKYQGQKVKEAKENKKRYVRFLSKVVSANKVLTKHFKRKDYTIKEVRAIKTDDAKLKEAIISAKWAESNGYTVLGIVDLLESYIKGTDATILGDNLKNNYRTILGDNPYDIKSKKGYGDNKVGHSIKDESHGSHVSGIIGAIRNNGIGMDGVAHNVKIMAVRAVPDGDEYDKDVALAIRYAVDNGAIVINTSFGKDFSPNRDWVYDAIKYAEKKDVLIVNAAGNDAKNIDVERTYPNDSKDLKTEISDNVITVGSIGGNYNKYLPAYTSNYGKLNVDIFAPGVQIYSTIPENEYQSLGGTSMAAPAVAGIAVLIRSYYPKLSASQIKHIIMNSGTKVDLMVVKPGSGSQKKPNGELVSFTDLSVSGRIANAYNALKMAERMVK